MYLVGKLRTIWQNTLCHIEKLLNGNLQERYKLCRAVAYKKLCDCIDSYLTLLFLTNL